MSNNILHVHPTQPARSSSQDLQHQLYLIMKDDEQLLNADLSIWLSLNIMFEKITTATPCRTSTICPRDYEDHQENARLEGESSAKRQKTFEYGTYTVGESSSEQPMDQEPNPSGSGTQEQLDKFNAWMDGLGTDDDEVPAE
ncbi:hypothetical protein Tco_0053731 [Tanacetum coccineum]